MLIQHIDSADLAAPRAVYLIYPSVLDMRSGNDLVEEARSNAIRGAKENHFDPLIPLSIQI